MKYLFEIDNLGFRPLTVSDADYLIQLDCDPEVRKYFPGGALNQNEIPCKINEYIEKYNQQGYGCLLVFDLNNNKFIGRAGMSDLETGETEIGYLIVKELWGNGYATRILTALLQRAKQTLVKDKVIAFTPLEHKSSERVMQKSGMKYLENRKMFNKTIDCVIYEYYLV